MFLYFFLGEWAGNRMSKCSLGLAPWCVKWKEGNISRSPWRPSPSVRVLLCSNELENYGVCPSVEPPALPLFYRRYFALAIKIISVLCLVPRVSRVPPPPSLPADGRTIFTQRTWERMMKSYLSCLLQETFWGYSRWRIGRRCESESLGSSAWHRSFPRVALRTAAAAAQPVWFKNTSQRALPTRRGVPETPKGFRLCCLLLVWHRDAGGSVAAPAAGAPQLKRSFVPLLEGDGVPKHARPGERQSKSLRPVGSAVFLTDTRL